MCKKPYGRATLRAISAFDFVIERAANRAKQAQPTLQSLAEQFPSLSAVALQQPLRKSHFLQALEDWGKIRRDLITPHTLRDFDAIITLTGYNPRF